MKRMIMCAQANGMDLVDYLHGLGYSPQQIKGNDYWYLSPLREEKTPSFKVARKLNLWYDHGIGKGGSLVDFGTLYYRCSVKEFLEKLEQKQSPNLSFHPPLSSTQIPQENDEKRLKILNANPITSPSLLGYIQQRNIDLELAQKYLKQVSFEVVGKPYTALGFQNNSGGYELRNEYFKASSSPKDVTLVYNNSEDVAVFEGFFSFLSYLALQKKNELENDIQVSKGHTSFLVLNSLSFLERSRPLMEKHASVHLYLDRDTSGLRATQQALQWSPKLKDCSFLYEKYKDLNDFLLHKEMTGQKQSLRRGRHI